MEMALKTLPANPNGAYKQVITWIFHAARPLLIDELREVLYLEDNHVHPDSIHEFNIIDIIEMCQSLIVHEESSGIIRFIHPTVQEYLNSVKLSPVVNLAKTCLRYLMKDAFDSVCSSIYSMEMRVQEHRFCLYAARFWGYHTRGAAESFPDIAQTVFKLLESEDKRDSIMQMETYSDIRNKWWVEKPSFPKGQTILHILAMNGLAIICTHLLDRKPEHESYIQSS
jgi:hypothetical protein